MEENKPELNELTEKQKIFCREYILDWNGTRAAIKAGYSENTAAVIACENLIKPNIKAYIEEIQKDLGKLAGISRLKVVNEYAKLAFSSIANLHNTWIERKDFEALTDDQKAAIESIDTKIRTEFEFDPEHPQDKKPITVEYVKIKLFDKQKALESICKMLGYNEAEKLDLTSGGKKLVFGLQVDPEDKE
jgi:phage terminase small subunit